MLYHSIVLGDSSCLLPLLPRSNAAVLAPSGVLHISSMSIMGSLIGILFAYLATLLNHGLASAGAHKIDPKQRFCIVPARFDKILMFFFPFSLFIVRHHLGSCCTIMKQINYLYTCTNM